MIRGCSLARTFITDERIIQRARGLSDAEAIIVAVEGVDRPCLRGAALCGERTGELPNLANGCLGGTARHQQRPHAVRGAYTSLTPRPMKDLTVDDGESGVAVPERRSRA